MPSHLCIRVTYPADRYHGTEWPPSPARLFQALLCGALTGCARNHWPDTEPALRAIEAMPAPDIFAAPATRATAYRLSVPNNDYDKAGREWAAGRDFLATGLRTLKSLKPWSLSPSGPGLAHVIYLWQFEPPHGPNGHERLASSLHTLGLGLDMAFATSAVLSDDERAQLLCQPGWRLSRPASAGASHLVPGPGSVDELRARFASACGRQTTKGVNPAMPVTSFISQPYRGPHPEQRPTARFTLRQLDDPSAWFRLPWETAPVAAAWLRHAAAEALREEGYPADVINAFALGHGGGHNWHMSFVPLPSAGSPHADAAVRRVLLLEPPDADGSIVSLLQLKLAPSRLMRLVEGGPPRPACLLETAPDRDPVIWAYERRATTWHTVTPVVLHGHNSEHGKFSPKKTSALLQSAFTKAGFAPEQIEELFYQPAPFWPGTGAAFAFKTPAHLSQWPRYHVGVRFREPVQGPLLIGIGQHYGIGLFAAADSPASGHAAGAAPSR